MKIIPALLVAGLLLAGCAGSDDPAPQATDPSTTAPTSTEPAATEDPGTVVEIVIADGKVAGQGGRVEVEAGRPVTLEIRSDADEEIHVHSDPEHTYRVGPGAPVSKTFTIDTPGQVAVEAHHLDVTVVQLVVRP